MEGYSFQVDASHETSQEAQAFESRYIAPFLNKVNKRSSAVTPWWAAPNPRVRPKIELFCGDPRSQLDLRRVGEALSGH